MFFVCSQPRSKVGVNGDADCIELLVPFLLQEHRNICANQGIMAIAAAAEEAEAAEAAAAEALLRANPQPQLPQPRAASVPVRVPRLQRPSGVVRRTTIYSPRRPEVVMRGDQDGLVSLSSILSTFPNRISSHTFCYNSSSGYY